MAHDPHPWQYACAPESPNARVTSIGAYGRGMPEPTTSTILAEMVASVLTVGVGAGDPVAVGDTVILLESMKMEIPVLVEQAGIVREVRVVPGDVIQEGDVLVVLEH
ncbi:MAG: biotin/lipoyl attachment protein [Marmoricola sp.]|nr:biotin/lipoyl attachment protein [Marmoricola sp.]